MTDAPDVPKIEISLRQWIDSVWFRGLARGTMMLVGVMFAGFLVTWSVVAGNTSKAVSALKSDVAAVQSDVATVQQQVDAGASDSEDFRKEIRLAVSDLKAGLRSANTNIAALSSDVNATQVDVGIIKRLLQDRNDVATRNMPPFSPVWTAHNLE